jgi:hypothetical protein
MESIIGYFRYVNDIFIIYNQKEINIYEILPKFTTEKEQHNSINFLNLTILHRRTKLEFKTERKPTETS